MTREEIGAVLVPLLREYTGRPVEEASRLNADLDLDSLDAVQILSDLEDVIGRLAFDVNDQLRNAKTVYDLTELAAAAFAQGEARS